METVKILVASEDEELPTLLRLVLQQETDLVLIGRARTGGELLALISDAPPDVVLVDLDAPGLATLTAIRGMAALQMPSARVVGLAGNLDTIGLLPGVANDLLLRQDSLDRLAAALRGPERTAPAAPALENRVGPAVTAPASETVAIPRPPEGMAAGRQVIAAAHPEPEAVAVEGAVAEARPGTKAAVTEGQALDSPVEAPAALGSISLIVGPFSSFRLLAAFQQAMEGLEGVRNSKTRGFHRGTLYATIQYDGVIPLAERLKGLGQFRPVVVANKPGSIELLIDPGE